MNDCTSLDFHLVTLQIATDDPFFDFPGHSNFAILSARCAHSADNGAQQWAYGLKCKLVHKSGHYIIVSRAWWLLWRQ
jgi:hypothetical protein